MSSWAQSKKRSQYHFDTERWNPIWDGVQKIGYVKPDWKKELTTAIENSQPVTWRTRGQPGTALQRSNQEYDDEESDLESYGMNKDHIVTNLDYELAPVFQQLANQFGLDDTMARIHVQHPGQVWNLHLDKLEKWMPADPTQVVRYFIQLTDWQQGHFWSYGNYNYSHWHAGEITTFDWSNVPHSTANAGHVPRATLQVTGVKTHRTEQRLIELNHKG